MTTKVKLFNKGKSVIQYGAPVEFDKNNRVIPDKNKGAIKPQEVVAFEPDMAAKLKRLYPKQLMSLDDVRDQFETPLKPAEKVISMQDQIDAAVAKALKVAIPQAVDKAIDEERIRVAKLEAERIERVNDDNEIPTGSKEDIKEEPEETEEQLLERLEAEELAAKEKKGEEKAKKEAKK